MHSNRSELFRLKNKTRTIIIIISIVVIAIMIPFIMNNYKKYEANKKAELKDEIILLELKQAKYTLGLDVDLDIDERLSNVEDLNTLVEPTDWTSIILKRWEAVHQINPDYPYPETEIKNQDWMGIHHFLYGETEEDKGIMVDGSNRDVYSFIKHGTPSADNPVVKEAQEEIYHEYYND